MITVMLVDDEPLANRHMIELLAEYPDVEIIAVVGSVAEARDSLEAREPDVVLLDVEMAGSDGFALLANLSDATRVVFVTAHEKHAVEAFAVGATDYLVKPVAPDRLAVTMGRVAAPSVDEGEGETRAIESAEEAGVPRRDDGTALVPLRDEARKVVVRFADICWIESLRNYTRVAMRHPVRTLVFRRRLAEWLSDLPEGVFTRISRSEVVQLQLVVGTEWKSRTETVVTFEGGAPPLTLGRLSSQRLTTLLEGGSLTD